MESSTITIHWHDDSSPIYSVDFQPWDGKSPRLATAGGDNNVRIWEINSEPLAVNYLSTLSKHTQAVNVVKFNKKGDILASAGDDGLLILWRRSETMVKGFGSEDEDMKESWIAYQILRNSTSEIYDISWSPNGEYIVTGSMDNSMRVYHLPTGKVSLLTDHTHYVQGVAWDPLDKYLVTQSADRTVNIYEFMNGEPTLKTKSQRGLFEGEKSRLLYHSETLQSFFRRLTFSPDGSLLIVPSGVYRDAKKPDKDNGTERIESYEIGSKKDHGNQTEVVKENGDEIEILAIGKQAKDQGNSGFDAMDLDKKETGTGTGTGTRQEEENAVYIYMRSNLKSPVCLITGFSKPAVVVAFSPIQYRKSSSVTAQTEPFQLPYKMIFAIATQDSVFIYSTETLQPLGYTSNLHYSTITDLAWDKDGQSIIVSSTDGFCSIIKFKKGIFGKPVSHNLDSNTLVKTHPNDTETSTNPVVTGIETCKVNSTHTNANQLDLVTSESSTTKTTDIEQTNITNSPSNSCAKSKKRIQPTLIE